MSHSWGGANNRVLPFLSAFLFGLMTVSRAVVAVALTASQGRAVLTDMEDVLTCSERIAGHLYANPGFNWELRDYTKYYKMFGHNEPNAMQFRISAMGGGSTPGISLWPTEDLLCGDLNRIFNKVCLPFLPRAALTARRKPSTSRPISGGAPSSPTTPL